MYRFTAITTQVISNRFQSFAAKKSAHILAVPSAWSQQGQLTDEELRKLEFISKLAAGNFTSCGIVLSGFCKNIDDRIKIDGCLDLKFAELRVTNEEEIKWLFEKGRRTNRLYSYQLSKTNIKLIR